MAFWSTWTEGSSTFLPVYPPLDRRLGGLFQLSTLASREVSRSQVNPKVVADATAMITFSLTELHQECSIRNRITRDSHNSTYDLLICHSRSR